MGADARPSLRAFTDGLKPDVTVESVERPGALPISAALGIRGWWDRRRCTASRTLKDAYKAGYEAGYRDASSLYRGPRRA